MLFLFAFQATQNPRWQAAQSRFFSGRHPYSRVFWGKFVLYIVATRCIMLYPYMYTLYYTCTHIYIYTYCTYISYIIQYYVYIHRYFTMYVYIYILQLIYQVMQNSILISFNIAISRIISDTQNLSF